MFTSQCIAKNMQLPPSLFAQTEPHKFVSGPRPITLKPSYHQNLSNCVQLSWAATQAQYGTVSICPTCYAL